MKLLLVCVLGLLLAAPCLAQDDDVVKVKSNLVNIDVIVKDKKGKYVPDLKAEDFTIFENGVQQKLEAFDAPLAGSGKRGNTTTTPAAGGPGEPTGPATSARNYVTLVLDSQTTDITNLKQVREGMLKYAREQLTDADVVALLSVTNTLNLIQQFTTDKNQLIAALEKLGAGNTAKTSETKDLSDNINALRQELNDAGAVAPSQVTSTAGGSAQARLMILRTMLAQFIKLRTALSIQQSRPILAALAAICEGLRTIPGKKTLVLFSQGFVTPAILDWQVQSTIDLANRANVAIYIVDSAGLRANTPASGALVPGSPLAGISGATNQEERIRAVGGETVFDNSRQEGLTREYDILYRLSGDTGGRFLKGSNDIGQGLERINEEIQARYTLAYRSTNQNFDSSFRKVKIEVRRPDTQIISRSGYYAIPPEEIVLLSPADKKLFDNFASVQASPGFPVSVSLSAFRWRDGLYTVPVAIELPPDAVQFDRKGDKRSMHLEVLGVLKATPDKVLTRLGGNFDVNLSDGDYKSIVSNNIFYRQDLQLTPGDYTIDLIVRDRQSGKISAKREQLVLPDLDAEFAATDLVLSRRVDAVTPQLTDSPDVFTYRNTAIRPSAARQFRATDNLVMYLGVYNAANSADTGKPMVRVTARLMKDGQPATKPFDFVLSEIENKPVPHLTFAEYIRLTGMTPGNYTVTIDAKDMVSKKLFKREASFTIVP
jgi:VWFA-related protein